jgi:AraC-like DNA-binding protein
LQPPAFEVGLVQAVRRSPPRRTGVWFGPFRYPTWVMDWCGYPGQSSRITSGRTTWEPVPRPARSWHIYPPTTSYAHIDHHPTMPVAMESLWFFFQLSAAWPVLGTRPVTVLVDPDERLTSHLHAMFALQQQGVAGHQLALHGHAQVIFGEVLLASQGTGDGSPQHPWRIQPAVQNTESLWYQVEREVLRDLSQAPTIDALAEQLSLSPSSLCHRFSRDCGMSVMQRVRWLRIREARRLLAQPGSTVKSVARKLGFSSPFHLSKMFHDISGMTAKDYLSQLRR